MNKKIIKCLLTLIIAISVYLLLMTTSNAALSISTSKTTVSPGESFSVTVSVSSNEAGAISLSASNGTLSSTYIDLMSQSSVTVSCTAGSSGTISIYASGKVANYDTEKEGQQSASKSVTISAPGTPVNPPSNNNNGSTTNNSGSSSSNNSGGSNKPSNPTKPEETKSNDSTLKSLVVEGYELYPTFDANTREYNLRVTNDITKVTVTPTVNHSKASYKIEGATEELVVGKNVITVVVTAEDGTTSNYVINVTRDREGLNVQYIKIYYTDEAGNRQELLLNPEFTTEIFEYTLNDLSYLISKLDVEVLANLEQAKIEITGNEELVEGANTIIITVTMPSESEEEEDEVLTYKITVNREKEPVVTLMGRIKNWFNGITGTITTWYAENQYKIIMGALMLCSASLGGLSVYLIIDYKKYSMLVKKVAEITRMNNSASRVAEAPVDLQPEQTKIEEKDQEVEDKIKSRGRHFE